MIGRFIRRLSLLIRRRRAADDLAEEMRLHVELRAAANRRHGLDDQAADRRARRQFGNVLKLREESQDMWGFTTLERCVRDARHACRQLIRRPGWTATVLLTLALGIGANTSIFTIVNATLFRPAPGQDPDRLVWVAIMEGQSGHVRAMSYPVYVDLRDRAATLSGLLAYSGTEFSIGGQRAERVYGAVVSGNYFDVLGIAAAAGRTFRPDGDAVPGAYPVVVLSDRLWRNRFGGDPGAVGAPVTINGRQFTIIGVAPPGFVGVELGENVEVWVPMAMQRAAMPSMPDLLTDRGAGWLRVVGRLRHGSTAAQADAELRGLSKQSQAPGTAPDEERVASVIPVRGGLDPSNRRELVPVFALLAIVPALVLFVACFNIANVLLARNVGRRKEFAMRRAIGATRARLVGQLLVEAVLLALLAAIAGFVVSFGLTAVIVYFGDVPAEVASVFRPDGRVLAATTTLAVLTSLVFGLAPALTATNFDLLPSLKSDGPTASGADRHRLRSGLVVAQVAVSIALLITAGLFLRSLSKAINVDPGFEARGAATISFDPALQGYTREREVRFVQQLLEGASALPGVTAASVTSSVPLSGRMMGTDVVAEGGTTRASATFSSVAPHYFDAMQIGLVRGRDFSSADAGGAPPVVIINEELARRLWPGGDAIGKRLRVEDRGEPWREVVAIARDGKYASLTERSRAAFYMPVAQQPASPLTLVARTAGDPRELMRALTATAQELDRDMPLFRVQLLEDNIRQVVDKQRAVASLLGVFGAITLFLAAIGIYGVAAHAVSLRTREIGIRMSLGARAADVLWMFVRETLTLAIIGVAIGLAMSAVGSQVLTSFLFGLRSTDGLTFAAAATLLCLVAMAASYVPARRATRVNPVQALRHD